MASITLARLVACLSILRFVLPNIWDRAILKKSNTEMHFRCTKSILISYKCITNYMNNLVANSLHLLIFYFKREYKLIMVLIMCTLDGHISIIYRSLKQHRCISKAVGTVVIKSMSKKHHYQYLMKTQTS